MAKTASVFLHCKLQHTACFIEIQFIYSSGFDSRIKPNAVKVFLL